MKLYIRVRNNQLKKKKIYISGRYTFFFRRSPVQKYYHTVMTSYLLHTYKTVQV